MTDRMRFSKSVALAVLDAKATSIAERERFNRSHGTRQMNPNGNNDELVRRAVEYGRMRAFEEFACSIEEGFKFESAASMASTSGIEAEGETT